MPQKLVLPFRQLVVFVTTLLLVFLFVTFPSCTKTNFDSKLNVNPEQIEKFLKITADAPQEIDLVIKELRSQLYADNFVDYFLLHHGHPLWNKALILTGTNKATGKVNCIIPVANTAGEITAYIKCNNIKQDGFSFKAYNKDYMTLELAQAGKSTQKYLKDLAILCYFEHALNNKTSVLLKNGMTLRLDSTNAQASASLVSPCGGGEPGPGGPPPGGGGGWVTICNNYPCSWCFGNDPDCPIGGSYTVCTTIYMNTNLVDPCGGGGGGDGGTGGDDDPDPAPCPVTSFTNPSTGGNSKIISGAWYVVSNFLPCDTGGGGNGGNEPPPFFDYSDLDNPVFVNDDIVRMPFGFNFQFQGFNEVPDPPIKTIGKIAPRGNTEDMDWGYDGDASGILSNMPNFTDQQLFDEVEDLFHKTSTSPLETVADNMIATFRNNLGGTYSNATLSQQVFENSKFKELIVKFGVRLNQALENANWNIDHVSEIDIPSEERPIFNGLHNKFNGLQILINDTEETIIELTGFSINATTHKWTANLNIIIKDHFGLDKNDALTYQDRHAGFAAWWILQHSRGYKPFETQVKFKMDLVAD